MHPTKMIIWWVMHGIGGSYNYLIVSLTRRLRSKVQGTDLGPMAHK